MRAVVMAGGEGSRLRPLTCNMPKPLVPLCGKPVIEYIFDLLIRNGIEDVCVTTGYLSDRIINRYPEGKYHSMKLSFSNEEMPLGTAGSVKNAIKDSEESILVISGDSVCDFDLDKIIRYHTGADALVTVVGYTVDDPREYGLIEKDDSGRIQRFLEKPSWGQATTSLANTGIYVLSKEAISEIPDSKSFDFAKDLFPKLMQDKKHLNCYHAEGYWCDIGDIGSYLKCQKDLLLGKIRFPLKKAAEAIYAKDYLPSGNYTIVPPVYIGSGVEIADDAIIGPMTVIEDECVIESGAKIAGSVLHSRASVRMNATIKDALMCEKSDLRNSAQMYERCVLGASSVIGAHSTVFPGVRVWPEKHIEQSTIVRSNIKFDENYASYFDEYGIHPDVELTVDMCVSLGSAIGSIPECKKVGVSCDGSNHAKAMLKAMEAGILSAGGHVWNFGESFDAQLSYCTAFCGLKIGVFIYGGQKSQIRIYGESGLPLPRELEREIEMRLRMCEYKRCLGSHYRDVADMASIRLMYNRELSKQAQYDLRGITASVCCSNNLIRDLMEDTLLKLGCLRDESIVFDISEDGLQVTAHEGHESFPIEKLQVVCCDYAFRNGYDVALPFEAPMALDKMASEFGRKVLRYLQSPLNHVDSAARNLSAKQFFLRDGLYMTIRILNIMKESGKTLSQLCADLPEFYTQSRMFTLSFSPARLHELFAEGEYSADKVREGITLRKDEERMILLPTRDGKHLRVFAEANRMETAKEMCDGFEKILKEIE